MLVTPNMIGTNPDIDSYGNRFEKMGVIYDLLIFVSAIIALILIREHPPTPPSNEDYIRHKFSDGLKHIFKQKDMLITIALLMVGLGIFNAVSSMTDSLAENIGVKGSDGLIGGLMLIGGVIGALILPVLSDKLQKRKQFLVLCMAGAIPGIIGLTFTGYVFSDAFFAYNIALVSSFILGFFVMSAGPIGFQYAAEVSYPAPESTSQGLLLWVGQILGMLFVAGMSMNDNEYLNVFMVLFSILSVFTVLGVLLLNESPMMKTN